MCVGGGSSRGDPPYLLRCLALTSGMPSWRAWSGRTSQSWKLGPRPRRMVRGEEKEDPILSLPWVPLPPPSSDLLFSPDLEGVVEAVACFAYTGRTAQELSFQRGDVLRLHERASGDWWRGECAGAWGLIPHKYITLPGG